MNRLCVAISRAHCGLYLFGNHTHLAGASSKGWKVHKAGLVYGSQTVSHINSSMFSLHCVWVKDAYEPGMVTEIEYFPEPLDKEKTYPRKQSN